MMVHSAIGLRCNVHCWRLSYQAEERWTWCRDNSKTNYCEESGTRGAERPVTRDDYPIHCPVMDGPCNPLYKQSPTDRLTAAFIIVGRLHVSQCDNSGGERLHEPSAVTSPPTNLGNMKDPFTECQLSTNTSSGKGTMGGGGATHQFQS